MGNGYTGPRCPKAPRDYLDKELKMFHKNLGIFATFMKVHVYEFHVNKAAVGKVGERVHQRLNYYRFFHGMELH